MNLVALILIAILIAVVLAYVRSLSNLFEYAHARRIPIFGRNYGSVIEMYGDLSFLTRVFSGSHDMELLDDEAKRKVRIVRKLLIVQLIVGAVIFFVFMLRAISA